MTVHPPSLHDSINGTFRGGTTTRRQVLAGLLGVPALALLVAACGDDGVDPSTSAPDATPGSGSGDVIEHSNDPSVALIRLADEGGFVPVDTSFVRLPSLIISGDGRAFVPGAVPEIYPGPLVMPMGVRSITEAGIQRLLGLARLAGLLAPAPDYSAEIMIADAPDTVVSLTVGDGTFEHRAYALGFDTDAQGVPVEVTPARRTLLDFVRSLRDLVTTVGASELGEESLFEPAQYRLRATPVTDAELVGLEPAPTFVDWPDSTGLDLTTASDCARVPAAAVGTLFTDADQLTFFRQGDALYRIAVAGVLPGDPVC
jgi:hypothetical protein